VVDVTITTNPLEISFTPNPCPGVPHSFTAVGTAEAYTWLVNGTVSGSGNSLTFTFPTEGSYTVLLQAISGTCTTEVSEQVNVVIPNTLTLTSKETPAVNPITVCSTVETLELEVAQPLAGATYQWFDISSGFPGVLLGTSTNTEFEVTLQPIPNDQPTSTTVIRIIGTVPFPENACPQSGELTIYRSQGQFRGAPFFQASIVETGQIVSTGSQTGSNTQEVSMCSGNKIFFNALSVPFVPPLTESGISYRWFGPGISSFAETSVTVGPLDPGDYTFSLQAFDANNSSACGSNIRKVIVHVTNGGHQLTIEPVQTPGFDNDFFLRAAFSAGGTEFWITDAQGIFLSPETMATNQTSQDLEMYNPSLSGTAAYEACWNDGKYNFYVLYTGGCQVREDFTLLGKNALADPPLPYNQSLSVRGNVFVHHDFLFDPSPAAGTLTFSDADVFARGVITPDPSQASTSIPDPGVIEGTYIIVSGANAKVKMTNSRFGSVLDKMWGGIKVNGIAELFVGNTTTTSAYDVVISDAGVGLELGSSPISSISSVEKCRFENCFFGMKSLSSMANPHVLFRIKDCEVVSSSQTMKKPYHARGPALDQKFLTYTGMLIGGTSQYPQIPNSSGVLKPTFSGNRFTNCIHGLAIGLDAAAAARTVVVDGCTFTNNAGSGILFTGSGVKSVQNAVFQLPFTPNQNYANLENNDPNLGVGIRGYNTSFNVLRSTFAYSDPSGIQPGPVKPATGIAVDVEEENTVAVGISGNVFRDLTTSIQLSRIGSLEPATVDFTLKCNQFKISCAEQSANACNTEPERKGLVIGAGVRVTCSDPAGSYPDEIGGIDLWNSGNQHPNANEWPVAFPYTGLERGAFPSGTNIQMTWTSPVNWKSLENDPSNPPTTYHRYRNEFVHTISFEAGNISTSPVLRNVKTAGTPGDPLNYEPTCEGLITVDDPIFPARIAVVADSQAISSKEKARLMISSWLGEAVPNPAQKHTSLMAFIPATEELAILQFIEYGTGRILSTKAIAERGKLVIDIDLSQFPAGVYGYQLLLKDKKLGAKRFVVFK
jgi:hypothetical protein